MATNARSAAWAKVRTASSLLLGLALIGYVMVTGIRMMAGLIAPGVWGYLGVAGYLTLVGPAPFLLLLNRNTRWVIRNLGPIADARQRRRQAARLLVDSGYGTTWIAKQLGVTKQAVDGFPKCL